MAYRLFSGLMGTYPRVMRKEISAVKNVLKSPYWNMNYGSDLVHQKLESEFAEYIGTKYAIAVNTGGMAIQIALRALGIKPGDEVIHQVDTCIADPFAIIAAGGTPVFSDIAHNTFMLDKKSLMHWVSDNTKVIIPVHMWGNPENMTMIAEFAKQHNLMVIEDAALALGATYKGNKIGSFGNAGIFSFGCLKPIQAGEGGIITTNDEALAKEMRTIRSWGEMHHEFGVRDQKTLSWNGRISEVVAAVALEQLRAYPKMLNELRNNVFEFNEFIKGRPGFELFPSNNYEAISAYSQVIAKIDEKTLGISRDELVKRCGQQGIQVRNANFELLTSLSFFKDGAWREWILKGNMNRLESNYSYNYSNSIDVFNNIGVGFPKTYFLTKSKLKKLIKTLDGVLSGSR
ncbi:MAG: DegT/DnrJ/EryC1/StrS family aminotransferase [Clostridia bacterium]|nr:DegT/DnrJ/EryC1/StrS family aminotransferase [Clostridia bacterium]